MACPQVAYGGYTLQLWRAAVNILNMQLQRADKGLSSRFGLGMGLTTPQCKKISFLQTFKRGLGSGRISSINDLSERKWILERYDGMVWIGYGSG
jgi:hypothetical protein